MRKKINVIGSQVKLCSFTKLAEQCVDALQKAGYSVAFQPFTKDRDPSLLLESVTRSPFPSAKTLNIHWCQDEIQEVIRPGHILFTMSESTSVDSTIADALKMASVVITPTQWNVDTFKTIAPKQKFEIVPLGVDSDVFCPTLNRFPKNVFITAGSLISGRDRKGVERVISAFLYAFPGAEDVCLQVKCREKDKVMPFFSPKIQIITQDIPESDLVRWYQEALCYVSGSTGEGWGWHLHEAMACGKPVITTGWSGPSAFWQKDKHGYLLDFNLKNVPKLGGLCGVAAVPTIESLAEQMRIVYEDKVDAFLRGLNASLAVKKLTVENMKEQLVKVINRYV